VCEGCGDCSVESNCLSVIPKETPFGRKRTIDQNSCNKDYSCVNGFCPSFVTVEGGELRRRQGLRLDDEYQRLTAPLPEPTVAPLDASYDLLVTGVGGTGVVTVGQLITMAAHLEGKGASVLDFMGFAQKFGPVLSYIRIADEPQAINQVRIEPAQADALIGCDLVVSSAPKAAATYAPGRTRALVNTAEMSSGDFVRNRDANLRASERLIAISDVVGAHNFETLDANAIAEKIMGNTIYANVLMLGCAWQMGLVPVSLNGLMRAIELNGVEIDKNQQAFGWGRIAAVNMECVQGLIDGETSTADEETLDDVIRRRAAFLVDYQNQALAARYVELVERVRQAELDAGGDGALANAAARSYFKLLSYKDEYEVARLHTQTGFLDKVREDFGNKARIRFHLAPPLLSRHKDARGRQRKKEFGAWTIPLFHVLAGMRRLRGTQFDPFGLTAERRMERQLIGEFEDVIEQLLTILSSGNLDFAIEVVRLYMDIRGYGPVKEQAVREVREKMAAHAIMPA
ncbi:MAG: 2-oxoacid:acceptor oxidoreductase family protein, partial [Gammaproteobacteria bacterium]|nr:2-oxoacid:acceptor oxidoreductase family protein [Gammaproteobacteria bacterium]